MKSSLSGVFLGCLVAVACDSGEQPNRDTVCVAPDPIVAAAPVDISLATIAVSNGALYSFSGGLSRSVLRLDQDQARPVYTAEQSSFFDNSMVSFDGTLFFSQTTRTADFASAELMQFSIVTATARQTASLGSDFSENGLGKSSTVFAADNDAVYLSMFDTNRGLTGLVLRVDRASGATAVIAEEFNIIRDLQLVGDDIWYFIEGDPGKHEIVRLPKSGLQAGVRTTVDDRCFGGVVSLDGQIYCEGRDGIDRYDLAGRNRQRIVEASASHEILGQSGPWIYFAQSRTDIRRINTQTKLVEFVACSRKSIQAVAFGPDTFYWLEHEDSSPHSRTFKAPVASQAALPP